MKKKVVIICPTINEISALKKIIPQVNKELLSKLVIIDLNSTDGTVEYSKSKNITVYKQKTKGYGAAIQEVINKTSADTIVEFPPDGNSPPDKIPALLKKIDQGYDFVIASRYKGQARSYDDDIVTRFGNWLFTRIVNILFRSTYTDVLVGFRAYKKTAFDRIKPTANGLSWSVQLPIQFAKKKAKITEIECDEPARIGGVRKMHPLKTGIEIIAVIVKEVLTPL